MNESRLFEERFARETQEHRRQCPKDDLTKFFDDTAVRAHETDGQEQNDVHQKKPLTANIASTKEVIESDAVDDISLDIAFLVSLFVLSDSQDSDAVVTRNRIRRIPTYPKLNYWMSSNSLNAIVEILTTVIDDTDISSADREKMIALVQSRQSSNNDENEFAEHDLHIINVRTDLSKKIQTEFDDTHYSGLNGEQNFPIPKESLENQRIEDDKAWEKTKVERFDGDWQETDKFRDV